MCAGTIQQATELQTCLLYLFSFFLTGKDYPHSQDHNGENVDVIHVSSIVLHCMIVIATTLCKTKSMLAFFGFILVPTFRVLFYI